MMNFALLLAIAGFLLAGLLVTSLFICGALSKREKIVYVGAALLFSVLLLARIALGPVPLVNGLGYAILGIFLLTLWWIHYKDRQDGVTVNTIKPSILQKWLIVILVVISFLIGMTYWLR